MGWGCLEEMDNWGGGDEGGECDRMGGGGGGG